jgi:hypothetical protein
VAKIMVNPTRAGMPERLGRTYAGFNISRCGIKQHPFEQPQF